MKISESYYKSLLEKDRDTEIGILFVSERYLGNGKILEYSTEGAKKEVLNDSLATQTADETGYFSAFVTSPLVTDLNETYYGVGYVKSGENISYIEGRSANVVRILEREYLNENSAVDKSLLLPYLSDAFKKEHGLLEESVTLNLGGELSNAAGMALLKCYSDSVLYVGDELRYNDESATITEYDSDLGYYTLRVVTDGEFYKNRNSVITVTVNRGVKT